MATGMTPNSQPGLDQLIKKLEKARVSMQTLYDLYKDARAEYDSLKSQVSELTKQGETTTIPAFGDAQYKVEKTKNGTTYRLIEEKE